MITATAPGKIHLLGEHTSVYGKPALLAAIDKSVSVSIESAKNGKGFSEHGKDREELEQVLLSAIKKKFIISKIPKYKIEIKTDLPIGSGLGSSAAFSAASAAVLLTFLNLPNDKETIFEIAYEGEKFFHGNPSGGDLAAVVNGGVTYFRKEFEFLKTFSKLPFEIHENIKQFYLIDSGKPVESTRELVVNVVGLFVKKNKKLSQEIFDQQEQFVKDMVIALQKGNEKELIHIIRQGEKNLEKLGVVGKKAKSIVRSVENLGGAAKIIGGGGIKEGAGMILVYFPTKPKNSEFEIIPVTIENEGVTIDE